MGTGVAGRWVAVTVATLVAVAACGGSAPEVAEPGTDSTATSGDASTATSPSVATSSGPDTSTRGPTAAPTATATFTQPPPEETGGVEEPLEPPPESVSLDLAGLPVGGFAELLTELDRCVYVNWSGPPDIPPGLTVHATAVALTPPDAFVVDPDLCQQAPPCLGTGHVMDPGLQCVVGVRQVAATGDGFGELRVSAGTLSCPPGQQQVCATFAAEVAARGPDTIEWFDAQVTAPGQESPTEDESPTTDGGGDGAVHTG